MPALLKLLDEDFGAGRPGQRAAGTLRLASQQVCARTIIAERVAQEVALLNQKPAGLSLGRSFIICAAPDSAEAQLNPKLAKSPTRRQFDVGAETAKALAAFDLRRFILLVDDRQLDGLDDQIGITEGSEVLFLHLSPLKGG